MPERRPPEESFALLTPLVHYLVAKESVTVAEAAEHFDVAPERIRQAVRLLSLTGVPNSWGDPTMFDFDFDAFEQEDRVEISYLPALENDTVKLSPGEAGTLVAGLERLRQVASDDTERIDSLMARIRSAAVDRPLTVAAQPVSADETLRTVRRAIESRAALAFEYRKPSLSAEQRTIIPTRLQIHDQTTLVVGYDLDRSATRTFRLDRLFEPRSIERPNGVDFIDARERQTSDTIIVHATPAAALTLASYTSMSQPAEDGGRLLSIEVWDAQSVLRAIMSTGGEAQVVEPRWAIDAMRSLALAAMG